MKYIKKKPAVLLLQDGTIFHGKANGINGFASKNNINQKKLNYGFYAHK